MQASTVHASPHLAAPQRIVGAVLARERMKQIGCRQRGATFKTQHHVVVGSIFFTYITQPPQHDSRYTYIVAANDVREYIFDTAVRRAAVRDGPLYRSPIFACDC